MLTLCQANHGHEAVAGEQVGARDDNSRQAHGEACRQTAKGELGDACYEPALPPKPTRRAAGLDHYPARSADQACCREARAGEVAQMLPAGVRATAEQQRAPSRGRGACWGFSPKTENRKANSQGHSARCSLVIRPPTSRHRLKPKLQGRPADGAQAR